MYTILALLLLAQIPNLPTLNGAVTGVLRTAAGKPAAGVRVTAVVPPASADEVFSAISMVSIGETDAEGRYRLEGIPPGRYYISAGRVDLPTYYPGSTNLAGGTVITVPPATTVSGMDFALRDESFGRATASGRPPQTLQIPVTIRVEGGGKVPVFQSGGYPVLQLTRLSNNQPVEMFFNSSLLMVPLPSGSVTEEYSVGGVADLKGYTVKSITYGTADVQKETLKVQGPIVTITQTPLGETVRVSPPNTTPLQIVLESTPARQTAGGARVTGRGGGSGDEVYISGTAGTLYSDGSFEFQNVSPGLHFIMKFVGNSVSAGAVIVGNRDVDNVVLQRPQLFPADLQFAPVRSAGAVIPESKALSMVSILGRVLDETSQEPLNEGTVSLAGYGSTRRTFAIVAGDGFKISDLLPGTYNLTINVSGYQSDAQSVTIGFEDLKLDLIARKATP